MRLFPIALLVALPILSACTVTTAPAPASAMTMDAGPMTMDPPPPDPGTWSYVYANDIGPGTPGHCGDSGCHSSSRGRFLCGTTKDSCYSGLIASGLVSTSLKEKSALVSKTGVLAWFDLNGNMPQDEAKPNAQAATDVTAWLTAGAQND